MADDNVDISSSEVSNRRIVLRGHGGYDQLSVEVATFFLDIVPEPDQVIVQIKSCGMNFADLYTRQGLFEPRLETPFVMGREAAGIVLDVGSSVTDVKIGDRVACISERLGLWTEYAIVKSNECFILPDGMPFDKGAAFFINYLTAHLAVFDFGNLRADQKIFIHSIAGGVGWAATQLARTRPGVVVVGTASAWKSDVAQENGVHRVIDSAEGVDYVDKILEMFPKGVDVVLDNRSGSDFVRAQKLLGQMGRIVHLGANCAVRGEHRSSVSLLKLWWELKHVPVVDLINHNRAVCGFHLDVLRREAPNVVRRTAASLVELYNAGQITPRVDSVWTFDQVIKATEHLTNRKNIGKVILNP